MDDQFTPIRLERSGGRAPLRIVLDPASPSVTPASRLSLHIIDTHAHLLGSRGIDWGSGSGVLAIASATQPGVEFVLGVELDEAESGRARANAELNGVADRVAFLHADVFDPFPAADSSVLESMRGTTDFLIANPPFKPEGDGLGWRRAVLAGALEFLIPDAEVLLQVSRQYGVERTERLATDVGGYQYRGVLGSTDWVPFDQSRSDLRDALDHYAIEEKRSSELYPFLHPDEEREIGAVEALALRNATGASPRSQWRMHRLTRLS